MAGQKVQLLIERNEAGQISVSGPITDKMLCYGLLECAHDAIKDFTDKAQQKIVAPTNGDVLSISRR
jgi:hypothetical protein